MGNDFQPAYLKLFETGELRDRAREAVEGLSRCRFCPRACDADRSKGEVGICRIARLAKVSSFSPHFGEERPLVGYGGSGTIFFTRCNLRCIFCQNYDISRLGHGEEVGPEFLARIMIGLQRLGCHNINLVTPSHVVPQILEATTIAVERGLRLPLVYNTSGYDCIESLTLLDGVVDIYMPDLKYSSGPVAARLSAAPDYPQVARRAIREMHRQVGDLIMDHRGIALRGLLVRHLVLPEGLAGTGEMARFLAEEVSRNTYLNVMDQYRPCFKAHKMPAVTRPITGREYEQAVRTCLEAGLTRLDSMTV